MTAEELNELITDNIDAVIADLVLRGYYVRLISQTPALDAASLVTGTVKLMDASGFPLVGHTVRVQTLRVPVSVPQANALPYHVGESMSKRLYELNADGIVEIPLVPTARVVISVEGAFSREIKVPSADFDVLAYASDEDGFLTPTAPTVLEIRRN